MMRFVQSYARIPYMGLPINGPKWAEVRAIYARAHAHAYPHTPTRICMRTHTCSSFKETDSAALEGGVVPADFVQ